MYLHCILIVIGAQQKCVAKLTFASTFLTGTRKSQRDFRSILAKNHRPCIFGSEALAEKGYSLSSYKYVGF